METFRRPSLYKVGFMWVGFIVIIFGVTHAVILGVERKNMNSIANSYANTLHNDLLIGNYRQARGVLQQTLSQGFSKIVYLDPSGTSRLEIQENIPQFTHLTMPISIPIPTSTWSNSSGRLIFYYSVLPSIYFATSLWLLFTALNIPLGLYSVKALRSYYEIREKEFYLAERGRMARQVAHDIRSPLSALYAVIRLDTGMKEESRTMAQTVANRIENIAHSLLDLNPYPQSEANHEALKEKDHVVSMKSATCYANEVIEGLLRWKRTEIQNKNPNIRISLDAQAPARPINISPNDFSRVISNLINNSVEAIEGSGFISITLDQTGSECLIEIRDSGKGIDKASLKSIWHQEMSTKKGGYGLGLSHARTTVEMYGGQIQIFSQVNRGTTVQIKLPAR